MSNKREREKRREERLREETKVDSKDRRARLLQMSAGVAFVAVVAIAVLIVVSSSGGSGGDAANLKEVSEVDSLLGSIPQQGLALGNPQAKVEVFEYGDLQCPVCKAYSEEVLPQVIEGPIEQGQAQLIFRNFTIIGPDSKPAGAAALAAGAQGRGWNFLELFYRNQGKENSGYATDEFFTAVAKAAGVKDIAKWDKERKSAEITSEVSETTEDAQGLGFTGTPSFTIKGPSSKRSEQIEPRSAEELEEAINAAS